MNDDIRRLRDDFVAAMGWASRWKRAAKHYNRTNFVLENATLLRERDHALASLEKAKEALRFYADCPLVWEQSLGGTASPIRAPLNVRAKECLRELEKP